MKSLLAIGAAFALSAPSAPPGPKWSDALPPPRFVSETATLVAFVHPDAIARACAPVGTPPEGLRIIACTLTRQDGVTLVVMPHPIFFAHDERFAHIMAHELAHVNGWQHEQ